MKKTLARYMFASCCVLFACAMAVLAGRHFDFAPERPAPSYRTAGSVRAKIHIVEFTDFACPSCKIGNERLKNIMKVYGQNIRLSFKHFPLESHKWAFEAAVCAECAGKQGKFSQYADALFDRQEEWSKTETMPADFSEIAGSLGLNVQAFEACRKDTETATIVKMDVAEGDNRNITATPTFFFNRKRAVGAGQMLDAAKLMDKMLK